MTVIVITFNPNDHKQKIVDLVKQKTQRTLNIEGEIKLTIWPKIGIDLGKISLSAQNSKQIFASINGAKVALAVLPLLKKYLVVDTIYFDGATVNIIKYKDGTTNFDDLLSHQEDKSQDIKFDINGINISHSAVNYTDESTGAIYNISKLNLASGHVTKALPVDIKTNFYLTATQPKIAASIMLEGNLLADIEANHYVAKNLSVALAGDLSALQSADVKLSGDVDAKLKTSEFLIHAFKLVASGKQNGAQLSTEVSAPQLEILNSLLKGDKSTILFTQVKAGETLKTQVVLAEFTGTPQRFESGGVKADIDVGQGKNTMSAHLNLADVKGSLKAVQSSGINGDFNIVQGARHVKGKFSSPFNGNLENLIFDLPKLSGNVDVQDTVLPNGMMKGSFSLGVNADVKKEFVSSHFNLLLDDTKLNGDVTVTSFKVPNIKFNLNADRLNLNKLLGKSTQKSASNKPTDLSAFKTLLIAGKLNVGSVVYNKYSLSNLIAEIKADGRSVIISPLSAKLDDSQIKGSLGISQLINPLYKVNLDIDTLDLDRYLSDENTSTTKTVSNKPMDLSNLKALHVNGSLRIANLKYGKTKATNVRVDLVEDSQKP